MDFTTASDAVCAVLTVLQTSTPVCQSVDFLAFPPPQLSSCNNVSLDAVDAGIGLVCLFVHTPNLLFC